MLVFPVNTSFLTKKYHITKFLIQKWVRRIKNGVTGVFYRNSLFLKIGPWCYTTNQNKLFEYCTIRTCTEIDYNQAVTPIRAVNPCSADPCGRLQCVPLGADKYRCNCPPYLPAGFHYDLVKRKCGKYYYTVLYEQ